MFTMWVICFFLERRTHITLCAQEHPSIKAIANYCLQKSSSDSAFNATLQALFSQTQHHVGFVFCERLINMPVQVIPHMYRMLTDELKRAIDDVSASALSPTFCSSFFPPSNNLTHLHISSSYLGHTISPLMKNLLSSMLHHGQMANRQGNLSAQNHPPNL